MLKFKTTKQFDRDMKRIKKRNKDISKLNEAVQLLLSEREMPSRYEDHALSGDWSGYRDCHIQPDWILIYRIDRKELILTATRTGSHSDIF